MLMLCAPSILTRLLTLAVLAVPVVSLFIYYSSPFSLDDAAIYQRIVKLIAFEGRYSYNLHESVNPGTSILYPFLLAGLARIVPQVPLPDLAVAADHLMLTVGTLATMSYVWGLSRSIVATVVASLGCFFIGLSQTLGMECCLLVMFMALYLQLFHFELARKLLVALFPLVRPEGVVFIAVEGVYSLLRATPIQPRVIASSAFRCLVLSIPLGVACLVGWALFGELLPHSATNKLAQGSGGGWQTYRVFLKDITVLSLSTGWGCVGVSLSLLGAFTLVKRRCVAGGCFALAIAAWQFGLISLKAPYYTWYSLSLYFFIFVLVCLGIGALESIIRGIVSEKAARLASLAGAALVCGYAWIYVLPAKRMQPESRQPAQYKLASLISGIHSGGHAQVAALEVGHLGNALDEKVFSIYDLCGLTSKNKGFFQAGFLEELFCTRRPEYLVLNLFELRALEPFTSSQEVEGVTITRYSQSEYHKTAWPHHVGLVLDRRFVSAYHFLQFSQSEGYPGGFALFKRNENFSCTDVEIYPEKVTASREHDPSTSASKVIDGDLATTWNAGDGHVQWLRFEFSKAQPIGRIRLWANQDREYSSKLRLRFWSAAGALEKSIEVPITVVDGDEIEIALQSPQLATRVEVESVRGHNWAAWREVRFLR